MYITYWLYMWLRPTWIPAISSFGIGKPIPISHLMRLDVHEYLSQAVSTDFIGDLCSHIYLWTRMLKRDNFALENFGHWYQILDSVLTNTLGLTFLSVSVADIPVPDLCAVVSLYVDLYAPRAFKLDISEFE